MKQGEERGTSDLRELAKYIYDFMKRKGFIFFKKKTREPTEIFVEELLVGKPKGRYYTRIGRDLFIYVEEKGELIDPNIFPEEIDLFGPESEWSMNSWMAIVKDVEEKSLELAETILVMQGFERWDQPEDALKRYFTMGDFSVFKRIEMNYPF
jgi:hypothetical protein